MKKGCSLFGKGFKEARRLEYSGNKKDKYAAIAGGRRVSSLMYSQGNWDLEKNRAS